MQMSFFSLIVCIRLGAFFGFFFFGGFCLQYGLLRFIAFCQRIFSSAFPKINIANCQTFKYFGFERNWWKSFQKRVVRTNFDIYVFISRTNDYLTSICRTIECRTCDCRTNDCLTSICRTIECRTCDCRTNDCLTSICRTIECRTCDCRTNDCLTSICRTIECRTCDCRTNDCLTSICQTIECRTCDCLTSICRTIECRTCDCRLMTV